MSLAYNNINNFKLFLSVPLNPFFVISTSKSLHHHIHGKNKGRQTISLSRSKGGNKCLTYFVFKLYTRINI